MRQSSTTLPCIYNESTFHACKHFLSSSPLVNRAFDTITLTLCSSPPHVLSRPNPPANFPLYTSASRPPPKRAPPLHTTNQKHIKVLKPPQQNTYPYKMSEATPRITAPYLEQFSHQTVRILGKVRQLRGEQATIDAGGQISVFLNRVCSYFYSLITSPCKE